MKIDLNQYQAGSYINLLDAPSWRVMLLALRFLNKESSERMDMLTGPIGDELVKVIFEDMVDEYSIRDRRGNLIEYKPDQPFPVADLGSKLDGRIVAAVFAAAQELILSANVEAEV